MTWNPQYSARGSQALSNSTKLASQRNHRGIHSILQYLARVQRVYADGYIDGTSEKQVMNQALKNIYSISSN